MHFSFRLSMLDCTHSPANENCVQNFIFCFIIFVATGHRIQSEGLCRIRHEILCSFLFLCVFRATLALTTAGCVCVCVCVCSVTRTQHATAV